METIGPEVPKIAELALNAHDKLQPKTKFPQIVLPKTHDLHSLERYQTCRNSFRGHYATHIIDDFHRYWAIQAQGLCFIDEQDMSARVTFDLGDKESPGHALHTASLCLVKTTSYEAGILGSINKSMSQRAVFNYLQDWNKNIAVTDHNGEEMTAAAACQLINKIDITGTLASSHEVGDFNESKATLAKIEASSKAGEQLPKGFLFTCVPYKSLKEYTFFLRLSLNITKEGTAPSLQMRCDGLDALKDEMIEEFTASLVARFGEESVLAGRFDPK